MECGGLVYPEPRRTAALTILAKIQSLDERRESPDSNVLVVLLAECPEFVSIRINTGFSWLAAACKAAAYLNECPGTTRSSWSAVVISVAGYFTPARTLCNGEYPYSVLNSSSLSLDPYSATHAHPIVNF